MIHSGINAGGGVGMTDEGRAHQCSVLTWFDIVLFFAFYCFLDGVVKIFERKVLFLEHDGFSGFGGELNHR